MAVQQPANDTRQLATVPNDAGTIMEEVVAKGDLKALSAEQRATYYTNVCKSMGLNPFTKPFEYITLNGKLTLYATRTAADQLRKINGVSITAIEREIVDDLIVVTVRVEDKDGRTDEEVGAVNFGGLKGEAKANAIMKAITKAKRRATLSVCGLGWLDETEVETVPTARRANVDLDTGEIHEPSSVEVHQPDQPAAETTVEQAKRGLWRLVNHDFGWTRQDLDLVVADVFDGRTAADLDTQELAKLRDQLEATDPEERDTIITSLRETARR